MDETAQPRPGNDGLVAAFGVMRELGLPVVRRSDGSYRVGIDEGAYIITAPDVEHGHPPADRCAPRRPPGPAVVHERAGTSNPTRHTTARVLVDGLGRSAASTSRHLRALGVESVLDGAYAAEAAELALGHPGSTGVVDAVLLLGSGPPDPDRGRAWRRGGIPHLGVDLRPDRAIVGPLVVPGTSSCLGCHELSRVDRDPTWSLLAARHRGLTAGRAGTDATRPAIALLATALAAVLIVDAIDGDISMAGVSTEICPSVPELVHRHWARHPRCTCAGEQDTVPLLTADAAGTGARAGTA